MRVHFSHPGYEDIPSMDVPDCNLMGIYRPSAIAGVDEDAVLARALANPIASPRLRELVRSGDQVLILVDDATRVTPVARILPAVVRELEAAGARADQIAILTALGTHRAMTEGELGDKLGALRNRFTVHQHEWTNEAVLREFGRTKDGTRVVAHRLLGEAKLVLGLGAIVPHRVKGFSGGAKIAFPGVAGREIMERNQWEASMHMSETVMGVAENPMRLRMEEAAAMVGLRFIVNVVLDRDNRIIGAFAGDVVAAHRQGCEQSREINAARMPERADIVVIDSYPADRDFWQSAKAAYSGTMAVREGGSLVLVAPNPEGVASNHPNLLEIGYRRHAELVAMVQEGKIDDLIGVAILADVAQIIDHADCIMASPGVRREDAERLGFRHAETPQRALELAFERQGRDAKVAVLHHGGHILPLAGAREAQGSSSSARST